MGFLGDGAVAHGSCTEPFHDGFRRFNLGKRDLPAGVKAEIQHRPDRPRAVLHDTVGILVKQFTAAGPYCLLQQMDGFRGIQVLFRLGTCPQAVDSDSGQSLHVHRAESFAVVIPAVRLHPVQVRSAQRARCICKIFFDKGFIESDCFKQLGALVRLQRRNAHLGSDLQYAGRQCAVIIGEGFRRVELHRAVFAQFTDPLMRQVRVDRPGAEGNQ